MLTFLGAESDRNGFMTLLINSPQFKLRAKMPKKFREPF